MESILKARLVSIEGLQTKLKEDLEKLTKQKNSDNDLLRKRATDLECTVLDMMEFMDGYSKTLSSFLVEGNYAVDNYADKVQREDEKFYEFLELLKQKEDALKLAM